MVNNNEDKSSEESSENITYAINALKDLTGTSSETALEIIEQLKVCSTQIIDKKQKDHNDVNYVTEKISTVSLNRDEHSVSINEKESKINAASSHSTGSDISVLSTYSKVLSPKMDSPRENSDETNISYSSDFINDSITQQSKDEKTAWEKWFVMKQEQMRRKAEMQRKKELKKQMEKQRQEALKQKKIEDNEINRKVWLEKKKREEMEKKEKEEREKELKERERRINKNPEYKFENWNLRKHKEKKINLLRNHYLTKKQEDERNTRLKQNDEAVQRWMSSAKKRQLTPRISYAYCGGSTISFYDSTRPPSPTYVNPIPWQDPC